MTSRTLKLLTASTAFVAAASAGHAATISTTVNTPYLTSSSTAGLQVTGAGTISTSGVAAIEISNTVGSANIISVSTGGVISSGNASQTSATILSTNAANAGVVINNSGTILTTGTNVKAIDLSGMTNAATIHNAGNIYGNITFGDGAGNVLTSSGTTSGTITGGANADSLTFDNAHHSGDINLAAGANGLIVSNSTVTGNYTGGAGVDTITMLNSSTYNGNITTGGGADILSINGSRINGNISTSAASAGGLTTLTLTNAIVSGTIVDGTVGDADILNINGTNTFNQLGAISGFENVNINTNTVLTAGAGAITGASALTVAAAKTLTVNNSFATAAGGVLTNNGQINIAAGKTVTAATYAGGVNSGLGINVSDSTHAGKLVLTSGGITAPSITVIMGANAGYIASGTSFTIVDGAAASTSATLLTKTAGVYTYSQALTGGGQDISLTITRAATSAVVTGGDNKSVAAAIDSNKSNTNAGLTKVHSVIGQQTTAAGVNAVVESLTPGIDGAGAASVNVTVDTANQISDRLASVRSTSGVATGDAMASKHMWVQGFGSTVSQDDNKGNAGYDASGGGVSVGADTDTLLDGFTTGLAFSYGHGSVDSNSTNNANTDIDSYIATAYGSRVLDNGVFVNGQVGGGYNKYDMDRTILGVGKASGNTNGYQGTAKLESGKDFATHGFTLTPLASLQYTYLNIDKYTETGAGGASLTVNPDALSALDAGAGGQVGYAVPLTNGGTFKPSVHAKYIYRMGDTQMSTTSNFTGGGSAFTTDGVKADRSSVNLGAGMLLTTVGGTDLSLNYDADIRSNLTGHTGQLKARWAF